MANDEELQGKKLLILGASVQEEALVRRAQCYGVYAIVTDYYTDHRVSPAKDIADEYWDISWTDLDALEKKCREAGVNGVCAGYSEFRVEAQMKLCARLGLPCYITEEQLEITRDKRQFKEACRRNGVPVVREYARPEEVDRYPVIVKPVDRGGSIGVGIANDPQELRRAYDYAMEMSVRKQVIIERYITAAEGTLFDAYYNVCDGEIQLVSLSDTIDAKNNGTSYVVPSAFLHPSKYREAFLEEADAGFRALIRSLGVQNGSFFFSGFKLKREKGFAFFETGFRLEGSHMGEYSVRAGKSDNMDIYIFHALTGSARGVPRPEAEREGLKCVILNLYAGAGTIGKLSGLREIGEMEDCTFVQATAAPGQVCSMERAALSKAAMFHFCNADERRLAEDVRKAYERVAVTSEEGRDMIFDRMDPASVEGWWEK